MTNVTITAVTDPARKSAITASVLTALPEWFGLPESTQEYVQLAATLPFWAAWADHRPVGFIDFRSTSNASGEINCMGILKPFHHQGIGRRLVRALEEAERDDYAFLQVKTVDQGHYPEYDATVRFYEAVGFKRLEVFPTLWNEWNPCLILIKSL